MRELPPARKGSRELVASMRFQDFEVSWAGASPSPSGFCFGSEDGRVLLTDTDGEPRGPTQPVMRPGEAINGIAFLPPWMGVSTRNEIRIFTLSMKPGEGTKVAPVPLGAHDIIAGFSGYFFAPLGQIGFMYCRPTNEQEQVATVSSGPTNEFYCYRMISLQGTLGEEVIACAGRRGGVAALEFKGEGRKHRLSTLTFPTLDVVDICPLLLGERSASAVAVGIDGTIMLFRDVLRDQRPLTIRYGIIKGKAYRILSAGGNLFLLTSRGFYVITEVVEPFLDGRNSVITPVLVLDLQAVDANLAGSQWVLIVMPDGVLRFDVDLLEENKPADLLPKESRDLVPITLEPAWSARTVEHSSNPLVLHP
jgi:hypothetical protein